MSSVPPPTTSAPSSTSRSAPRSAATADPPPAAPTTPVHDPATATAGTSARDHPPGEAVPPAWHERVRVWCDGRDATVLGVMPTDLSRQMRFEAGLVVWTADVIVSFASIDPVVDPAEWSVRSDMRMQAHDHGGVGVLELVDGRGLLAAWHYTLAHDRHARSLVDRFEQAQSVRRRLEAAPAVTAVTVETTAEAMGGQGAITGHVAGDVAGDDTGLVGPGTAKGTADDADAAPTDVTAPADDAPAATEAPPSTWTLLRLWQFARPYRGRLLAGFLLTLASTGATLIPPYLTMPLMDKVLIPFQNGQPIDMHTVRLLLGGLLGASLAAWALGWARTYILALVSERIGADLRTTTYSHLLNLSLEYFGAKRTGDLMARIGAETDRINLFLSLHLLDFLTDLLMIAMTAVILVSINPLLAVVTLVPLPLIVWLIHLVRDRLRHGFEKVDRMWAEVTNVLADTIPGIRVVKAFAQEKREIDRFRDSNRQYVAINDRVNRVWSLFTPSVTLLTEIGLLIVWGCGIWLVSRNQVTVGTLTAFLAYIGRFYTRLDSMSRIVSLTQKAAAGAKRIFDVLDHRSSVPETTAPVPMARIQGRIEVDRAGFRYGNRLVLREASLVIEPGEMIGLVGHSGSGKSTLVNLILRFYDVTEGAVRVDGVDVRQMSSDFYRSHIGLVLQEPFLFFGTIAQNIAYGRPDATRAEIVAAARAANAHEFILRLPHGYDSLVGERGQALSGGERQRISIARALLIDPRILILDEATSAVDTTTEKEIQKALDNLVRGRTTIAIAHRLSTLRKADRLVVLDRGRIVEVGNHDELMQRRGHYHRLWLAQSRQPDAQGVITDDDASDDGIDDGVGRSAPDADERADADGAASRMPLDDDAAAAARSQEP